MKVSLMRHGEASFDAESDVMRPLTENGIKQSRNALAEAIQAGWTIDTIWHSRLLRAQQTASLANEGAKILAEEKSFLTPESEPEKVLRNISKFGGGDHLLIVSHQPMLGGLMSLMLHGHTYEAHPFATSEIVCLTAEIPGVGLFEMESNWRT